jgi:hypothetical protein
MKKSFTELFQSNWFFAALVAFVIVLPLSQGLVSVFSGVLLGVALIEDKWDSKMARLRKNKILLLVPIIFIIYVISTFFTLANDPSFYDVKKTMFYLVIPVAFVFGKEINTRQKRFVFYAFANSILLAICISLIKWKIHFHEGSFSVHNISLISHIRFSFQLVLIFWFIGYLILKNSKFLTPQTMGGLGLLGLIFLGYLFFQQSLTGLISFAPTVIYFLYYILIESHRKWKYPVIAFVFVMLLVPVIYVSRVIQDFYTFDKIDEQKLETFTKQGNRYGHNTKSLMVENGHFVDIYICQDEMREEWNKISEIKYDSIGSNGYVVASTLIRYLTSKGLRKDAEGVKALNPQDVKNIQNGMSNYIFEKRFSIYPRIYQTVWEYYVFTKTGNSNHQSFSQRIEFAHAALTIIKSNFFFGVGTGNWKQAFAEAFAANHSKLDESLYASSHNQYLNYLVKFGMIGFLVIMFLLVFPIIKTRRYRDPLFMTFLIFMFFANFADSNLESHMGSSFFFFFYCLFLTGPLEYLKLRQAS